MSCRENFAMTDPNSRFTRKFFIFVSVLSSLAGLGAIVCGVIFQTEYGDFLTSISTGDLEEPGMFYSVSPILFIVIGSLILLISLCGCGGALDDNIFLLKMYKVVLVVILLSCLVIAIMAFVYSSALESLLSVSVSSLFKSFNTTEDLVNYLQSTAECCGVESHLSWKTNAQWLKVAASYSADGSTALPISCCINPPADDLVQICDTSLEHYSDGCVKVIWLMLTTNYMTIGSFGALLAMCLMVGISLSCCVIRNIQEGEDFDVVRRRIPE